MPTYEYQCNNCDTKFEVSGSYKMLFTLKPACPNCRKYNCRKIISSSSVHYKDDGFTKYVKDKK